MLWRLVACDLNGNALRVLSSARARRFQFRLGQPASLEWQCRSDADDVAAAASDGQPVLSCLDRVVKAYRYEPFAGAWTLRFAGRIWQVTDEGEEGGATTTATAFDPLQMLAARNALNDDGTDAVVVVSGDGAQTLKALVERTNAHDGPTGLTTAGGTFEATPARAGRYERKPLSEVLGDLVGANAGFDVRLDYVDRTDGVLAVLSVVAQLGGTRSAPRLGYAAAPHNVRRYRRQQDGTRAANTVDGLGTTSSGATLTSAQSAGASVGRYGVLRGTLSYEDVTDQAYLDAQVQGDLQQSGGPVETYELDLVDDAVVPWVDEHGVASFGLGDRLPLLVGATVRGGAQLAPRVQGFDLDVSDEGVERVTSLYVAV